MLAGSMESNIPEPRRPPVPTLMGPGVEPWYCPRREMNLVFWVLPDMNWYWRAIFRAISTASEPPPQKKVRVRSPGARSASFLDRRIPGTLL